MAFTENTAFELKVSNHEFDSTANITGRFVDGSQSPADCSAGFLCTRLNTHVNEGYSVGNGNTWNMIAATDAAVLGDTIYACNPHNVQEIAGKGGNVYKIGPETLGLGIPAGELDTFTRIDFLPGDRQYRFGIGNISGSLGSNDYLTIDDGMLKPAASAPATNGALYFKVLRSGYFTEGAYNSFIYVDVEAHAVIA
jgi:hypothetical protein